MTKHARCAWAKGDLDIAYHDAQWGVPQHDEHVLFEFLILEGAQAGLSWATILKKRDNYRKAFADFDPVRVAKMRPSQLEKLLGEQDSRKTIVRNRAKVLSTVANAKAFLKVAEEFGSFDDYVWRFIDPSGDQAPRINRFKTMGEVPATTPESDAMCKDLRARGFSFVGTTICYAFMQAVGMVNDHTTDCFRYRPLRG